MGNTINKKDKIDFSDEICFSQFKLLRAVGRGSFGKVSIVKKRDTKLLYALKYMNKQKCINEKAVDNVLKERKILEMLHHNLLVNLWFAFQDAEDMFMVVDLMLGGDLRYHLRKYGAFSINRVRGYMAELSVCLEYIHSNGIIHRDIKPDNVLMDKDGHVHLADFNVATFIRDKPLTSRAGTRHYMAPEMVGKKGYGFGADWWSLGITMYEMLTTMNPVYVKHATIEESVHNICNMKIEWPSELDEDTLSFLKGLLDRDPKKRLGTPNRFQELKDHPFFKPLDCTWDEVADKFLKCEYVPEPDKVHCDAMYELEELMLEENPLHKKKRRLKGIHEIDEENVIPGSNDEKMIKIQKRFKIFNREELISMELKAITNSTAAELSVSTGSFIKDDSKVLDEELAAEHQKKKLEETDDEDDENDVPASDNDKQSKNQEERDINQELIEGHSSKGNTLTDYTDDEGTEKSMIKEDDDPDESGVSLTQDESQAKEELKTQEEPHTPEETHIQKESHTEEKPLKQEEPQTKEEPQTQDEPQIKKEPPTKEEPQTPKEEPQTPKEEPQTPKESQTKEEPQTQDEPLKQEETQ